MNISDVLKSRRKELGLTLLDIANKVGVSEATVQRWESGNIKNLRQERIAKLANVLEVTPAYLMGWVTENERIAKQNDTELSEDAKKIALAYEKADLKSKNIVRQVLDFPQLEENPNEHQISDELPMPDLNKIKERFSPTIEAFRKNQNRPVKK